MKIIIFVLLKIAEIAGLIFIPYGIGIGIVWIDKVSFDALTICPNDFLGIYFIGSLGIMILAILTILFYFIGFLMEMNMDLASYIVEKLKNNK